MHIMAHHGWIVGIVRIILTFASTEIIEKIVADHSSAELSQETSCVNFIRIVISFNFRQVSVEAGGSLGYFMGGCNVS